MTHEHHITLKGAAVEGPGTSGQLVAGLFGVFAQGTERALRYRLEGRSTAPGASPASFRTAADFKLLDIAATRGIRTFELRARPLFESMPERFAQGQLFEEFDPHKSPFDLFEDALEDALLGRADSDAFDFPLLETCIDLKSVLGAGLDSLEIKNGRTLIVDAERIEHVVELARQAYSSRRVRLAGRLETIRYSDCRFTLILASGTKIAGTAKELGSETLRDHFGQDVIVSGTADFRPSGRLLRINAENVEPATHKDLQLFAAMPRPLNAAAPLERRIVRGGLSALLGQWPGEESTDDLLAQLRHLA